VTVAIVFTGGTIASRVDPDSGDVVPQLSGAEILAAAPGVADAADVEAIDWGLVPASHMRFAQLIDVAGVVGQALARPEVTGAVLVQGTDSIEETCFAYDLLVRSDKPVVVTGAMRNASQPDYDGPRNLADAVRCAASADLAGMGTLVVLNGLVIGAEQAIKGHATAVDAFRARDGEAVGEVSDRGVVLRRPRRRRPLPRVPEGAAEPVELVTVTVGSDGSLIRLAGERLALPGIVVAATGSGNTPLDVLFAAEELMARGTTVVLTTRCPSGTAQPAYGFPGGGAQWARAGAIVAGLDGPKCRIALALGLGAGLDRAGLENILWATPSS
jgi:L-asparaginase